MVSGLFFLDSANLMNSSYITKEASEDLLKKTGHRTEYLYFYM